MFRFLGGRNSHRKRHARDDEKQNKYSGRRKNERRQQCVVPQSKSSQTNDVLFDNRSIEMSLYTTPSKSTIHYSCLSKRDTYDYKWQSSQGIKGPSTEFTAEVAMLQYRLGGWQSPPSCTSISRHESSLSSSSSSLSSSYRNNEIGEEILHRKESLEISSPRDTLPLVFISPSLKSTSFSDYRCSSRLGEENLPGATGSKSLFPRASHPVDVDSLMYVEEKESDPISLQLPLANRYTEDDSTTYSNTISDFGVQNLARMNFGTQDDKTMTGEATSLEETLSSDEFEAEENYVHDIHQSEEDDTKEDDTMSSSISTLTMDYFTQDNSISQPIPSRPNSSQSYANSMDKEVIVVYCDRQAANTNDAKSQSTEVSMLIGEHQVSEDDRHNCHVPDTPRALKNTKAFDSKNDICIKSFYGDDHSAIAFSTSSEQLSFSRLISIYEAESLAGRMAPDPLPTEKLIDRAINTNSSKAVIERLNLYEKVIHTSSPILGNDDIAVNSIYVRGTGTGRNMKSYEKGNQVKPSSTSKRCFSVEMSASKSPPVSSSCSPEYTGFSDILSKFEAQSLEDRMSPPIARRLAGESFQTITATNKKNENFCCFDKTPESRHKQHDFSCEISQGSTQSLHEQIPFPFSSSIEADFSIHRSLDQSIESAKYNDTINIGTCLDSASNLCSLTDRALEDRVISFRYPRQQVRNTKNQVSNNILGSKGSSDKENYQYDTGILFSKSPTERVKILSSLSNDLNLKPLLVSQPEVGFQASDSNKTGDLEKTISDITSKSNSPIHHTRSYTGLVDLDESTSGSSLDASTLQDFIEERTLLIPNFDHPLSFDRSFVHEKYIANANSGTSWLKPRIDLDGNWNLVDELSMSQHRQGPVKSIVTLDRHQVPRIYDSPGSLLLKEEELSRHTKLVSPLPKSPMKGYNDWRMKQETERLYFEKLEKAVTRQQKKDRERSEHLYSSESPPKLSQYYPATSYNSTTGTTKLAMDDSMDSTIPTIEGCRVSSQKKKTRRWNFISRFMHKKDDDTTGATRKREKKSKKKMRKNENYQNEVVSIDKFMEISSGNHGNYLVDSGDIADLSLIPLMKLGNLTKITSGDGPDDKMLQHLEWERMKQQQAEIDNEKDERREQIRISMLKEQELERQRRLNSSSDTDDRIKLKVASQGIGFSKNRANLDHPPITYPSFKSDHSLSAQKLCQRENIYSSGVKNYFCDRITVSTARDSESFESCSRDSLLHSLSFDSVLSPSSSLKSPNSSSSNLMPCVICKVSERSYISIPCMHYSFCSNCSEELNKIQSPICPICQTENIVLSRVYT